MSDIDKLNMVIMNIPVMEEFVKTLNSNNARAYKLGHRDARHAAVEAVLEHFNNISAQDAEAIRNQALEEAAKVADGFYDHIRQYTTDVPAIGSAIRALQTAKAGAKSQIGSANTQEGGAA